MWCATLFTRLRLTPKPPESSKIEQRFGWGLSYLFPKLPPPLARAVTALIHGRVLRVVYDKNLGGGFRRYEFESKLLLNERED